jgi:hypothetical protein
VRIKQLPVVFVPCVAGPVRDGTSRSDARSVR